MNRLNIYSRDILVALLLVLLIGCSSPKLAPLGADATILAFGDSLTYGVGTTESNSYPSVLAALSGLSVVNSGVSGETSDLGLKRFPKELDRVAPDLVILIEGGNDILQNRNHAETKANIKGMIDIAKNRGIPIVLVGVPNKNLFSDSAPFYKELADQYHLVFDSALIGDLLRSPSLKSDTVHLNKNGYRKMADSIYKLLRENGALI